MDLNADVNEGLDGNVDQELLEKNDPIKNDPSDIKELRHAETTDETIEEVFSPESDAVIVAPNAESDLTVIEAGRVKILDMKDIESNLDGQNGISQEDAKVIDETVGSFFSQRLRSVEFSKTPSKINFNYALRFVKENIQNEEEVFFNNVREMFSRLENETKAFRDHLDGHMNEVRQGFESTIGSHGDVFEDIKSSKDVIFPTTSSDFVNILTVPVSDLDPESIQWGVNQELFTTVKSIKTILDCFKLSSFILHKDIINHTANCEITLANVVEFYSSGRAISSLDDLRNTITAASKYFEGKADRIEENFENTSTILAEETANITKALDDIAFAALVCNKLQLLDLEMKQFFKFIK